MAIHCRAIKNSPCGKVTNLCLLTCVPPARAWAVSWGWDSAPPRRGGWRWGCAGSGRYPRSVGSSAWTGQDLSYRAGICRFFKETRNRFPAWRAGTTTLFFVPARQAIHRLAKSIPRNRFLGFINVTNTGSGTGIAATWPKDLDFMDFITKGDSYPLPVSNGC